MNLATLSVIHKVSAAQQGAEVVQRSLDPKGNPAQAVREQRSYDPPNVNEQLILL